MALQSVLVHTSTATQLTLGITDDAFVAAGVTLGYSGATAAIQGLGSNHSVRVIGSIFSVSGGIRLGDDAALDANNAVTIAANGSVYGESTAITAFGRNATVVNNGEVTGGLVGLALIGDGGTGSVIINRGTVTGASSGINHAGSGAMLVQNYGAIIAVNDAVVASGVAQDTVVNDGIITGDIRLLSGDDRLVNRGLVDGAVIMGAGADSVRVIGWIMDVISLGDDADTYSGRGSIMQDIVVFGGAGDDRFTLGDALENIVGDQGVDTISLFGSGQATTVYLDNSGANTGAARGIRSTGWKRRS